MHRTNPGGVGAGLARTVLVAGVLTLASCATASAEKEDDAPMVHSSVPALRESLPHPSVRAPPLEGGAGWINTDRPLSLRADLRGRVVVIDFWTSGCINCLHALPELKALERTFAGEPFQVIGVHSGKFAGEKGLAHVTQAVARYGIEHPVLVDPDFNLWHAYAVKGWPTTVVVDAEGYVVAQGSGEPDHRKLERLVGALIENARARHTAAAGPLVVHPPARASTGPLAFPGKVAALEGGRLVISDSDHHRILVLDAQGSVVAEVGSGREGFADGDFATAQFRRPQGVVGRGQVLYVADTENHALRKIDLQARTVTTLAGTGSKGRGPLVPGTPPRAQELRSPWDLALVGDTLYVAMAGIHQLWSLELRTQQLAVLAGSGAEALVDGAGDEAAFSQPSGLTTDGKTLYVADAEDSAIRAVDLSTRRVRTLVGEGLFDFGDRDGEPDQARLQHPQGLALLDGALYVADTFNGKVRRVSLPDGRVSSVTPTATFANPGGLTAVGSALVVADTDHHRLVHVDPASGRLAPVDLAQVPLPKEPVPQTPAVAEVQPPQPGADPLPVQDLGTHPVRPGPVPLRLTITLPPGFHWSAEAPTRVELRADASSGLRVSRPPVVTPRGEALEAEATVDVAPDAHGSARFELSLFFCTEAKGVCLVDRRALTVTLAPQANAAAGPIALAYQPAPLLP